MLVRRIKNSPRAIAITLIVSVSHDSNDAYPRKHLSIVISTFDLLRTIPSIRDFPLLATDIPLADQEICFEGSYKKPLYGKWMQYFVNIFPRRKAWRTKKKIFEQLEVIEEYMRWMIRERLSTFLQD